MPRLAPAALALLLTALGCTASDPAGAAVSVTGNWQFSSPSNLLLPALSGELTGSGANITALLHSTSAAACIAPTSVLELSGSTSSKQILTLTGPLAGGTLTVTGTLAPNGKSLTNASYTVVGGRCAFASPASASAQAYAPVTGNYAGSFVDAGGYVLPVTATLTQTPASDTSGNFLLSGTGTFGANGCINSPATVSNAQVSGGSFTLTYADSVTGNSATANGTFTPDGTTLNVTGWTLTGSCGPDNGTGQLVKQ